MPPLSMVGTSAASTAIGLPSGPEAASGSRMSRDASWSLVPCARCTFSVVGACQYRIFSWPPAPRPPPAVAGLAAAVGAIVGAGAAGAVVAAAAGAVVGAAAGAVVGAAAGAVVGLAPGAVVGGPAGAVGGPGAAAGPHAASNSVQADTMYAVRLIELCLGR